MWGRLWRTESKRGLQLLRGEAQIMAVIRPLILQKSKLNGKFGANENVSFSPFIKSSPVPSKSLGIASP